ncbi:hypothetical protein COW97_01810 [Candidatus Roizmanbacteria bacterium CG22_combo_CG10-13_8_21_14_all_34_12]|uniref:PIN domain-containing protein n=1 Tax=Candidatus Roizmanbacteria bacterium CG22_combo_CG10-13_8_21_14_all_34_12 TaxID=1974860 RepID=A0A2H0C0Z8_9BACT|nr:MAG: hypothetical protein COW97_01810 [Candidatus Roizmanbacteria bacterium CG22_combo_CG10-13_8_21_14_all_34_12]
MNSVYIDTNIFLYISNENSSFYSESIILVKYLKKNNILILTSTETIQEVIYVALKTKKLGYGLKTTEKIFEIIEELLSINKKAINFYLNLVAKHPTSDSRDSLHIAACIENKIPIIITYDHGFKKFKEIKALTPKEFLEKINL